MPEFRIDFLNWRPDLDDFGHDGLSTADNVVHEPEGYKPVYLASAGAFSTVAGLASVSSIVTKTVGARNEPFSAWIADDTVHVGINGVTMTRSTGTASSFATTGTQQDITAFDVAELNGQVLFCVEAQQLVDSASLQTLEFTGLFTVSSVS